MRKLLFGALVFLAPLWGEGPAELAEALRKAELDPAECYKVREVHFTRGDDLRFFFAEGYVIFGKPIGGRRISAVFSAEVESGDAELLVMPPSKAERISLANFTELPNLNEHFRNALFLFTDDSAEVLMEAIRARGEPRPNLERGILMAGEWDSVLSNLSASFSVRLVHQLLSRISSQEGFFYAGVQGTKLGNFDCFYDPDLREQIYLGQLKFVDNRAYYDTWTNFPSRAFRTGQRKQRGSDLTMSNFRIEGVLDEELHLKVATRATLTARAAGLRSLAFEISDGMRLTAVRLNGEAAEIFTRESLRANAIRRNESVLFLVVPAQPVEAGRAYEIEFEHEGDVVRRAGGDVFYVGSRFNWYPRAGTEYARFDVQFTYPPHLQLVFPGELKDDRTEGGQRTTRRVTPSPVRLIGFNLGRYEGAKAARGKLTVEVYANRKVENALAPRGPVVLPPPGPFPSRRSPRSPQPEVGFPPNPPDPTARLEAMAEEMASAFEFLAGHLGPPALDRLMVSPIPGTFGQGFPGLVYLSTLSYLSPQERPLPMRDAQNSLFFSELLSTHEVAHQWWGNVVTAASPQDEWLMESLANYSSLMLFEKKRGSKALQNLLDSYKADLLARKEDGTTVESTGPIRLGARLTSSQSPGAWSRITYGKGTWIVHMLRKRLGDEAFLKVLGEMCRKHRFQAVTAKQFQELAAAAMPKGTSDPKLDAFFEFWVEGSGIPALSMSHKVVGKAPSLRLEITVTQSDVGPDAAVHVPVEVQTARGRSQTLWVATAAGPVTVTLPLRTPPLKVSLDPEGSVLAVKK